MSRYLRIVVPAALAAGALLLSACGNEEPVASTSDTTASTPDTTSSSAAEEELQPVDCGEVTLTGGTVHRLVADPAADGLVGCTEAFGVIDEFAKLPPEQQSAASLGNVDLPSGWSCTVDDGETANVACVKDKTGDEYGFALHTEQQAG